jgi:hypothetical protein
MKAIPKTIRHPKSSVLEEARQSFEHWRATREKFGPIPAELWKEAVELAGKYPVTTVSKVLRLSYADLRKRMNGEASGSRGKGSEAIMVGKASGVSFVDILTGGNHQERGKQPDCGLEINDGSGFSMKLQCRGESSEFLSICRVVIERLL